MSASVSNDSRSDPPPRMPGVASLAAVLLLYVGAVLFATYPAVKTCHSQLAVAWLADTLQHLWIFHWYQDCLVQGRNPLESLDIQLPAGAPLGLFTPLQVQTVLYLGASLVTDNDILAYNLILFVQFLFTGLATFLLAWYVTRHVWGSTLAGLVVMLSNGMLLNAMGGGTELLALGGFPLFLTGWMRFVDRPSRGRLAAAVGLYLLLVACAPYYGVLGILPASLYTGWHILGEGGRAAWPRLKARLGWFLAFTLLICLTAPLLFPAHIWAVMSGLSLSRPFGDFAQYGTTIWHYVIPGQGQLMNELIPPFWTTPGILERAKGYVGVVTIGLVIYAAVNRVRFRNSRFFWASLVMLVVLSLGAYVTVGDTKIPMPALWLWNLFPPIRVLRVPARFGFFATVCAAVLAAGALKHICGRIERPRRRAAMATGLIALAIADLAIPFPGMGIPEIPPCYAYLRQRDPLASFCEIHPTERLVEYQAILAYWQSRHGGRTSAGYSGCDNRLLRHLALDPSPFPFDRLQDPQYLASPESERFDLVGEARFADYTWLYLTAHDFDYLIIHKASMGETLPSLAMVRIREALREAIIFEDDKTTVVDRRRMMTPTEPVMLATGGWRDRLIRKGRYAAIASEEARLMVYNPEPDQPLRLALEASSYLQPRVVRLRDLETKSELARWEIQPTDTGPFLSPPLTLAEGLHELVLQSDGAESPTRARYAPVDGDMTPFSLWVNSVTLQPETGIAANEQPDGPTTTR